MLQKSEGVTLVFFGAIPIESETGPGMSVCAAAGVVLALCMLAAGFLIMDITSPKVTARLLPISDPCAHAS